MKKILLLWVCAFAAFTVSAQGFASEKVNGGKTTKSFSSGPIKFQAYANVGTVFSGDALIYSYSSYYERVDAYCQIAGPTIDVSAGIMIKDRFYIGAEIGTQFMFSTYSICDISNGGYEEVKKMGVCVPIGLNLKGYILNDRTINPFINVSFGGGITSDLYYDHGVHCQVGAGIEWKRYSFGMGYNLLYDGWDAMHAGYIKLGVRIGK